MMTKDEVRSLLPKVGEVRMERPTESKAPGNAETPLMECVVIEVNREHMWYRVKFKGSGFTECYKLPKDKLGPWGGVPA